MKPIYAMTDLELLEYEQQIRTPITTTDLELQLAMRLRKALQKIEELKNGKSPKTN